MFFEQRMVTPEEAKIMLATNTRNRNLNKKRIDMLANDILNGNWTESPQPICFDNNRNLIDGQHRLNAIIKANMPALLTIAFNVQSGSVIDKGLERDCGSSLYMRGVIDKELSHRAVIAIVNRYYCIAENRFLVSDSEKGEFINKYRNELAKTISIANKRNYTNISKKTGIQTAIFAALVCGVSEEVIREFVGVVNSGFMEDQSQSAAIVLRKYAQENKNVGGTAINDLTAFAQMAIKDFASRTPRRTKYHIRKHIYIDLMKQQEEIV